MRWPEPLRKLAFILQGTRRAPSNLKRSLLRNKRTDPALNLSLFVAAIHMKTGSTVAMTTSCPPSVSFFISTARRYVSGGYSASCSVG